MPEPFKEISQSSTAVSRDSLCFHCGLPLDERPILRSDHAFCCQGCAGAYELIAGSGMLDYYEFRTEYAPRPEDQTSDEIWELIEKQSSQYSQPIQTTESDQVSSNDSKSIPDERGPSDQIPTVENSSGAENSKQNLVNGRSNSSDTSVAQASDPSRPAMQSHSQKSNAAQSDFLIEGIHCSSCVWLNETMLRSVPGVLEASGNLATNRLRLAWNPQVIKLKELAHRIEKLGYRLLPLRHSDSSEAQKNYARNLLKRMVVAGFFAGNIMLVSVSLYAGYFGVMDRFTRNFFHLVSFAFATPVMLYSAAVFFRTAWASLKHGVLSMDLLTSSGLAIAFFYSIYAAFFEAGEVYFDSVCFVTFAVLAGRYLESRLKLRSLYLIDNLQQAESPFARKIHSDGQQEIVPSESLLVGDIILLKPGESLPCDSVLLDDSAEVEQSLLTGEFEPITRKKGDLLLSGIKAIGEMKLEVRRKGDESALRQIQTMASESLNDSPRSQKFAEMAGRYFVGFVLIAGIAAFYYHFQLSGLSQAIIVTVTLLIVACPCALNLAIPTAFIAGIQRSYSSGILYRNGQHLETVARARHIIFDKTGTLTAGRMEISREFFASNQDLNQLRSLCRNMESRSGIQHPVVRAFESTYGNLPETRFDGRNLKYHPGQGLSLTVSDSWRYLPDDSDGTVYYLGSFFWLQMMQKKKQSAFDSEIPSNAQEISPIFHSYFPSTEEAQDSQPIAQDGFNLDQIRDASEAQRETAIVLFRKTPDGSIEALAVFLLHDSLRPQARQTVAALNKQYKLTILSGDSKAHVSALAEQLGIQDFHAQQSPQQKRDFVRKAATETEVMMIGDGINDSAALASADAGISFAGGAGLALNSSDILLLNNRLQDLSRMILIARSTRSKIIQNLILAFSYNILLLPIAFAGYISPFLGALFMSLSSITVIVNSIFAGRVPLQKTRRQ